MISLNKMKQQKYGWVILCCTNGLHFYLFVLLWGTPRLFPISGYYEQSSTEDGWVSSISVVGWSVLWVYVYELFSWILRKIEFHFLKVSPHWFWQWIYQFFLPPGMDECSPYSTSLPTWAVIYFTDLRHFDECKIKS